MWFHCVLVIICWVPLILLYYVDETGKNIFSCYFYSSSPIPFMSWVSNLTWWKVCAWDYISRVSLCSFSFQTNDKTMHCKVRGFLYEKKKNFLIFSPTRAYRTTLFFIFDLVTTLQVERFDRFSWNFEWVCVCSMWWFQTFWSWSEQSWAYGTQ